MKNRHNFIYEYINKFNIILKGQIIKAKLGTKERYCHIGYYSRDVSWWN